MKLRFFLPCVIILAALSGCSTPSSTGTDTGTGSGTTTEEGSDGTTPAKPWAECAGIVERLNSNDEDPTVYEELEAADFAVPEVGADVLARACVIRVTVNADPITWAILPGDEGLATSIVATLQGKGFASGGLGLYGDQATGRGITVQAFANGAAFDAYLVYSKAFAPVTEPIVYLGTFALS